MANTISNGSTAVEARALWDMVDGPMPRGLLGLGDPDVHFLHGRWTMFLGGFTTSFRNRLYRVTLADDGDLARGPWQLDSDGRGRAQALTTDPPRGGWDAAGMHTPSYVPPVGGHGARLYYTGRATSRQYGPGSRYAIGVLEQYQGRWHRRDTPVLSGEPPRSNLLEPFVVHTGEVYRMWFQATTHEAGPGEQPDYELRCTDSVDGLTGWTSPKVFTTSAEGFFDNTLAQGPQGWVMLLARPANLHATPDFPAQGLWCSTAATPSGDRADWSEPIRLLETGQPGTPAWMACGCYGPALVFADQTSSQATAFVAGARDKPRWPGLALRQLSRLHRPPVPAPFYLATGIVQVDFGFTDSKDAHQEEVDQ